MSARAVVLGIGNRDRGDDAFGPAVIDLIIARSSIPALDGGKAPENYLPLIASYKPRVVLCIDAAELGRAPGHLTLCGPDAIETGGISTHAGSVTLLADYLAMTVGAECLFVLAQRGDGGKRLPSAGCPSDAHGASLLRRLSPRLRAAASRLARMIIVPAASAALREVARV
ncbi:MAG: hydrogenase maturation protease [Phycisphaerae bacterium]|nr:hydrogenase maturation protease [Phycisphaerae bacterium]